MLQCKKWETICNNLIVRGYSNNLIEKNLNY